MRKEWRELVLSDDLTIGMEGGGGVYELSLRLEYYIRRKCIYITKQHKMPELWAAKVFCIMLVLQS